MEQQPANLTSFTTVHTPVRVASEKQLIAMIQAGCFVIVAWVLLNLGEYYLSHGAQLSWTSASMLLGLATGIGCLLLCFSNWFVRNWRPILWVATATLVVNATIVGVVGGEPILLFITLMLLMSGTGSLLPWSTWLQGSFSLVCLAAWAFLCVFTRTFEQDAAYRTMGLVVGAGLAQFTCHMRIRYLAERADSEFRAEETGTALRKIFDANLDSIAIIDFASGRIADINAQYMISTGYSQEETLGKTFWELGIWNDRTQSGLFLEALKANGQVRNMQVSFHLKDGRTVPCELSGVLLELNGQLSCLTITRDISESKASKDKLLDSEAMLREMFDASLDNISVVDMSTGVIIEANNEAVRTLGFSKEEMIGKRTAELNIWADLPRQELFAKTLLEHGEVRNFEHSFRARDGRTFPALISASLLELGGKHCALAIARDITDLEGARQAALAASRAKSEFLASMSHEIRTPMNSILGMADLIGEGELNPEQRRYLDAVISNGNGLLDLINSILDLAKVESGRLSLEAVEFDLIELTERVADSLAMRAHGQQIELAVRFAPEIGGGAIGDPMRLRQILTNLVGNAIKFTERGEVVIKVELNRTADIPGNLLFSVTDTGTGIARDKVASIFSAFTQADSSTTRKYGGSGLGLAIVERLVELMGGRVWVESELGKGSTFYFTTELRCAEAPAGDTAAPACAQLRGIGALIADNNATTRVILSEMLHGQGAQVSVAVSGAEAIAMIEAAGHHGVGVGLMLVDADLAAMDGFETVRRARKIQPTLPVIMLMRSNGLGARLTRMREVGVENFVPKPIKKKDLYHEIAVVLSHAGVPAPAFAEHSSPMTSNGVATSHPQNMQNLQDVIDRPLHLLVADDSPDNRLLIAAYLKKTRYLIDEVENGQIAFEHFVHGSYDAVLMDIQMPILDGYGAVRAIRQWELDNHRTRTPILALTASALEGDIRRAKEAGCDLHVSKPVRKSTLLGAIASVAEKSAGTAEIAATIRTDEPAVEAA